MCATCSWEDAAKRLDEVVAAFPQWKTKRREFYESVAERIRANRHVSEAQLELVDKGEDEAG